MKRLRVTRQRRCPICGRDHWCLVAPDGSDCICTKVQSDRRIGDAGWLHKLAGAGTAPSTVRFDPLRSPASAPARNWPLEVTQRRNPAEVARQAELLGVSPASLEALEAGWDRRHAALSFPMRDSRRRIIGLRLRTTDGSKFAVPGSRNGLFIPVERVGNVLAVAEGPTDTAALLTLGFSAIGRPHNTGGHEALVGFCRREPPSSGRVVIFANADPPRTASGALTEEAARRLAHALAMLELEARIVRPPAPHKDVRAWLRAGAGGSALREQIEGSL